MNIKSRFLLILFFAFAFTNAKAQQLEDIIISSGKNPTKLTFFEIQQTYRDFEKQMGIEKGFVKNEQGELVKFPGWKQYKRWEYFWELRVNPSNGKFPDFSTYDRFAEMEHQLKSEPKTTSVGNWTSMGSNFTLGGYAGLGRINCISFHPTDTNTYWVGSPSGGIWKTTNDGASWTVLSDQNQVLGVSDIAVPTDYEVTKTLYIATGDRDGGSVWSLGGSGYDNASVGVLKTTNGGISWNKTTLSFNVADQVIIGRLLIHPTNNNTLIAATSNGVYKTVNGGTFWTQISTYSFIDMEFHPTNPLVIYASTKSWSNTKVYKSIDGGENWEEINTVQGRRTELAVSPDEPNAVWAVAANAVGGLYGIYKSDNQGTLFSALVLGQDGKSFFGYFSDGSGDNNGQGSYDLAIAVDPNDAQKIYIGGVNSWRSLDGGTTWEIMNMWTSSSYYNKTGAPEVHADKHCLKFRNNSSVLFETNDGGVYKATTNGNNWRDKSSGLSINQIYRMSVAQTKQDMILTGLQDNGSKMLYNGNWSDVTGGDGMECIIDYKNEAIQYATYANGTLYRTNDYWNNYSTISDNIGDGTLEGAWVTPYVLHPTNPQILFVAYEEVYKSLNRGGSFTQQSTLALGETIKMLAISPSNPFRLAAGTRSALYLSSNEGGNWTDITANLPIDFNSITNVLFNSADDDILYVTLGGYGADQVYKTINGGLSWTNISNGLPSLPAMDIIQNKRNTQIEELYVAMDVGVYVKYGNDNWQRFSEGMPNVVVTDLDIYYDASDVSKDRIYAASFGRGVWKSELYDNSGIENPGNFAANPVSNSEIQLTWSLNSLADTILLVYAEDGIFGIPNTAVKYLAGNNLTGGGVVLKYSKELSFNHTGLNTNTKYYYKIWSKNAEGAYSSGTQVEVSTLCGTIDLPYIQNFNETTMPTCWEQQNSSGVNSIWSISQTENAGGDFNELKASYIAKQEAYSRIVLPLINIDEAIAVNFSFDFALDAYEDGVSLKIQTSFDKDNWVDFATVFESNYEDIGPINFSAKFDIVDENTPIYFALVLDGDLYAFDYLFIDNLKLEPVYNQEGAPLWNTIPAQTIYADEQFTDIQLYNYVQDEITLDENLILTVEGAQNINIQITNGAANISRIDQLWTGKDTISFVATDEAALVSKKNVVFTVLPTNIAPKISGIENQVINQRENFASINLDNFVSDDYSPDEAIVWQAETSVVYTVSLENRVLTLAYKDVLWYGADTITLTATDQSGLSTSADVIFTVNYMNYPPEISDIPSQKVKRTFDFEPIDLSAYVTDDYSDAAAIVWSTSTPNNLTVTIDNQIATIKVKDSTWTGNEMILFTATDEENAYSSKQVLFTVEQYVGIFSDFQILGNFSVFPNPAKNMFRIDLMENANKRVTVSITDISGALVYRKTFSHEVDEINVEISELPKGIYMVYCKGKDFSGTQKIVIQQ
jgi:hypothetical protein